MREEMIKCTTKESWVQFLQFIESRCSKVEFKNWFVPIKLIASEGDGIVLEVPNVFLQEYLLDNYKEDLAAFIPVDEKRNPLITFVINQSRKEKPKAEKPLLSKPKDKNPHCKLNGIYIFDNFIEGPSNQFIKSAALGVAVKPGKSYNPLFIHGGVGLGKTHLLHAVGHYVQQHHRKLRIHCITTEGFINDLVSHLRHKSIDKMKRFYRTLDVLLVDDIQFLQNRLNFEEEFCNTFESLINQNKQIVVTSDKPPGDLKLSERMIARMEWGVVAHVGMPDLETRVAILQHKAEQGGIQITNKVAFFIAEHVYNNVRQLEGAINRLGAYCRLMNEEITEEMAERSLSEMFQKPLDKQVSVDEILKGVSSMYNVRISDLKGAGRTRNVAFPRQVAMYLAKEMMSESLMKLAASFGGKTHSTLLHAWKKVSKKIKTDETLRRQIQMTKQNIEA